MKFTLNDCRRILQHTLELCCNSSGKSSKLPSIPHWDNWNLDKNNNHKAITLDPKISWQLVWLHLLFPPYLCFSLQIKFLLFEPGKKHEESPRWNSSLQNHQSKNTALCSQPCRAARARDGIDMLRIRRLLITELAFMFEVLPHSLYIYCEQIICRLLWAGVESKKEGLSPSQCQDQSTKDPFGSCHLKA